MLMYWTECFIQVVIKGTCRHPLFLPQALPVHHPETSSQSSRHISHPHILGLWLRNLHQNFHFPGLTEIIIIIKKSKFKPIILPPIGSGDRLLSSKNGSTASDQKSFWPTGFSPSWYLGRKMKMAQSSVYSEYFPRCLWLSFSFIPQLTNLIQNWLCLDCLSWVCPVPFGILGQPF